ncbi:putative DNA-binding transcriptional regulator [compost metagenome]
MRVLRLPYPEAEQLFRRMVFNVIARNCDDHSKNFAFIMDKKGKWTLSPAYDVCHAYRPGSLWVSTQSLMVNGKREGIIRADLLEVARRMNIKSADSIIEEIQDKVDNWEAYADRAKVSEKLKEGIKSTLLKL